MGKHGNGIKPKEDWSQKTKKERRGNKNNNEGGSGQGQKKRKTKHIITKGQEKRKE